jgi:hypothetical protein
MNRKCEQCDANEASPNGVYDLGAYDGAGSSRWLCPAHMPKDWTGWARSRLNDHEMLAIHAHVERNMEKISRSATRAPGLGGERPD